MSSVKPADVPAANSQGDKPPRSAFVLLALVTGAIVANINLSIANVALPTIGQALGASQAELTNIANAFALGLASTVLYLGTIGDRYGRKLLFVLGAVFTIPTAFLAAYAPSAQVLVGARLLGGIAAALLFPTTLSLIGALYRGRARVTAIALWSGLGGSVAALGPVLGGWLLGNYWWGSVFLITLPLDVLALVVGLVVLPKSADPKPFPVDHIGGILSIIGVGGIVLAIQRSVNGLTPMEVVLAGMGVVGMALFLWRQTKAPRPLVDLTLARARTFWIAFVAGAITFGSLIGSMFIGQQFMQNVLGYSALHAAATVLAAAVTTAICGQLAGPMLTSLGTRPTFSIGLALVAIAFALMLGMWHAGVSVGWVIAVYALIGAGIGFSSTTASRALMASVPQSRSGMGSAFLDLTRDFGGAIIQALMGALLAAAYAAQMAKSLAALPSAEAAKVSSSAAQELASSYGQATEVAKSYPNEASSIIDAARLAFTDGKSLAVAVALGLTLIALALVLALYPRKKQEEQYFQKIASSN